MLKDAEQRAQASDPTRSFLVQAPAGSGKTELLTQRFLRLLTRVQEPEQIIALTFTRKAASEMRERILIALMRAENEQKICSDHQRLTNAYALAALKHSQQLQWNILKQPGRLKIMTIDALCQLLSHSIPLHEQWVPYGQVAETPEVLYEQAVRACIETLTEDANWHLALEKLLEHLDNRQDKLIQLLCHMLGKRDEWLPILFAAREQTQECFEQALELIEQHELQRFLNSIPLSAKEELRSLCWEMATLEDQPTSPRYALIDWHALEAIDRPIAAGLAALLLTKDQKLRQQFDHHVGLKRGDCPAPRYVDIKARSKELLDILRAEPEFIEALIRVGQLPEPQYSEHQWQLIQILLGLFPLLAAHLQLLFRQENTVDFSDIAAQASLALGSADEPTDLALYLDHNIHHLLIDEFQDTSLQQYQLLSKLVQGWLVDQGKTLFLVGDPMQSIYRFRQAEVGLFLRVKQYGLGSIAVQPLELCCNFRSTETIIHWLNEQFAAIFPKHEDMETGAIRFYPCVAGRPSVACDTHVQASCFPDKRCEAEFIVRLVEDHLQRYPEENIAILVRSRAQLKEIIPLLRTRSIPFQGVDIEKLSTLSGVEDVWSLVKALLRPADRIAWLAFLRSPWAGLTLADLHCLANFSPKESIYQALIHLDNIPSLSPEGLLRLRFISEVIKDAYQSRQQKPLIEWLEDTLLQLQGDSILTAEEQQDLESLWQLLLKLTPTHGLPDFDRLESAISKQYIQKKSASRLQIMTIHKSKGLEFDTVILPGLGSKAQKGDKPLLRWLRLPQENEQDLFLLSPIQAAFDGRDSLYEYLNSLSLEKDQYEQQRLLYVAATRAKKRLYLSDTKEQVTRGSFRALLNEPFNQEMLDKATEIPQQKCLQRLPSSFYTQHVLRPKNYRNTTLPTYSFARTLGIITHELLQWIGNHHEMRLDALPWSTIEARFIQLGVKEGERANLLKLLRQQIEALFNHPIGVWIFEPHTHEHNEHAFLVQVGTKVVTRIVDRFFYDQGYLWVIDFKTGIEENGHRQQVQEYAALLAHQFNFPIRCGLFYLATMQWTSWDFHPTLKTITE